MQNVNNWQTVYNLLVYFINGQSCHDPGDDDDDDDDCEKSTIIKCYCNYSATEVKSIGPSSSSILSFASCFVGESSL